jgi:hypothetical protein
MNTMTLSDLQTDDDNTTNFDISNDVFAQARQRLIFFHFHFFLLLLTNIYLDYYQQIYLKHHHVVNKNQVLLQHLLQINLMHKLEGKIEPIF